MIENITDFIKYNILTPLKPNINTKADLKLEGTEEIFYNKVKKALE